MPHDPQIVALIAAVIFILLALIGSIRIKSIDFLNTPKWARLCLFALGIAFAMPYFIRSVQNATPSSSFPVGTILAYGGQPNRIPVGWRVCDGSALKKSEFQRLWEVLGTTHGEGYDSANVVQKSGDFNLPDYRGRFLRGVDGGRNLDPDAKRRVESARGGAVGDNVGSIQEDATKPNGLSIELTIPEDLTSENPQGNGKFAMGSAQRDGTVKIPAHNFSIKGDLETRPKNASVIWLIRVE